MRMPIYTTALKMARGIVDKLNPDNSAFGRNWKMFPMKEYANALIYQELISDKPTMIARIGSTEMWSLTNYLGVKHPEIYKNYNSYIRKQTPAWWWEPKMVAQMQLWSGFFPGSIDRIEQFCELMIADMAQVDILGSWLKEEQFFSEELSNAKRVMLEDLEPFFCSNPWTSVLEGKRVLVVHPFADTIQLQYLKRDKLFEKGILPGFELSTIKAVQSIAGEKTPFKDWFEALEWMKKEIDKIDFDICILGCGAYGFPLAGHVKRMGKKAIHLGGVTQLLFGIKGRRWEDYIVYPYTNLYNEHWVRPAKNEKPVNAEIVEGATYW